MKRRRKDAVWRQRPEGMHPRARNAENPGKPPTTRRGKEGTCGKCQRECGCQRLDLRLRRLDSSTSAAVLSHPWFVLCYSSPSRPAVVGAPVHSTLGCHWILNVEFDFQGRIEATTRKSLPWVPSWAAGWSLWIPCQNNVFKCILKNRMTDEPNYIKIVIRILKNPPYLWCSNIMHFITRALNNKV